METNDTPAWQHYVAVIQTETDPDTVDAAICALRPLIEETALRICRRRMVREQLRLDFVAGSVAEIAAPRKSRDGSRRPPRAAEYNPTNGVFTGWLFTVLDNLLKDQLRTAGRRAVRETTLSSTPESSNTSDTHADPKQGDLSGDLDRILPFTKQDIKRLDDWPALDRVLFLAVFELRQKIPEATWNSWCQQAELPIPFPPDEYIPHERGDWINLIAKLRVESPNALQNRIRRRLKQLRTEPLDYVRGIHHDK